MQLHDISPMSLQHNTSHTVYDIDLNMEFSKGKIFRAILTSPKFVSGKSRILTLARHFRRTVRPPTLAVSFLFGSGVPGPSAAAATGPPSQQLHSLPRVTVPDLTHLQMRAVLHCTCIFTQGGNYQIRRGGQSHHNQRCRSLVVLRYSYSCLSVCSRSMLGDASPLSKKVGGRPPRPVIPTVFTCCASLKARLHTVVVETRTGGRACGGV